MIETLNDDKLIVGDMGAEIYTVSIQNEKNREFVEGFKKDTGHYPTWLRGKAYMATMFWAEAVKKAGSTDVEAVIKAWEGLTYDGPAGIWTMRACDHQAQVPYWVVEIKQDNPFFNHAFAGPATMIPATAVEVPCEETLCSM
jgi:branched-chain amino acid transport system substrate-binding protein